MRETHQQKQTWWQAIDIPGLIGCIALIFGTYAMFWHYTQSIKGHIEPGELGLKRAATVIWADED